MVEDEWERERGREVLRTGKREEGEKERRGGRVGGARFDSLNTSPCRYSVCVRVRGGGGVNYGYYLGR